MKDKIADMMKEEDKLKQFLMVKLEEAKQDVDKTLELVCEAQREEISKVCTFLDHYITVDCICKHDLLAEKLFGIRFQSQSWNIRQLLVKKSGNIWT